LIAPGCHITDVNHGIAPGELIRKQPLVSEPVRIGNDVWLISGLIKRILTMRGVPSLELI
jgi:acetyltransferase-like isoleucine patch superfamily enzyme